MGSAVDRRRIGDLTERELARFHNTHARSLELIGRGRSVMPRGVPMSWMDSLWGHPPVFVDRGEGAHFTDVDGHRYLDMNIADTSTFCGYAPGPVVRAVSERIGAGSQFLLPTEDALWVSEDLGRRWGLPRWQFTLSATFANTEAIRVARHLTGERVVLMFVGNYHGHADEMLVTRDGDGLVVPEYLGLLPRAAADTDLVEFNDLDALERRIAVGDVACVLTEPALTNVGVILPDDGFHASLRELTRSSGALLVIDETHTLITAPGGLVERWGLEPDIVTLGKSIGGGIAVGAYGMTVEVASALEVAGNEHEAGTFLPEVATGGTLFATRCRSRHVARRSRRCSRRRRTNALRGSARSWRTESSRSPRPPGSAGERTASDLGPGTRSAGRCPAPRPRPTGPTTPSSCGSFACTW